MGHSSFELGPGGWVMLLGWPAVCAAVAAFAIAWARRNRAMAIVGLLLATPMFAYLSATPRFSWTAPVAFALLGVLVWRFEEWSRWSACLLALPAAGILIWLAYAVMAR